MKSLRFKLAGMPVAVEPTFFVILVLLGIMQFQGWMLVSWVLIAAVSVLVHEMGHAIAFRLYGHRPSITLHGMGGVTSAEADLSAGRSIVVSLAGPLSVLFLFGIPAYLWYLSGNLTGDTRTIAIQLIFVNIGWSLLNLVPVLPLDGGQVTRSVLDLVTDGKGERPARIISIVLGAAMAYWATTNNQTFLALFGLMFVMVNFTELNRSRVNRNDDMLGDAVERVLRRDPAGALTLTAQVLASRPQGVALARALDLRAWCLLATGDLSGARGALAAFPGDIQPSARTQGALALAEGREQEGITLLTYSLSRQASEAEGLLIAQFLAATGLTPAVTRELLALDGARGAAAAARLAQHLRQVGQPLAATEIDRALASGAAP